MAKYSIIILSSICIWACQPETNELHTKSNESIQKEVCDCFSKTDGQFDKMIPCYELQDHYWKTLSDSTEKAEFLNATYACQ